MAFMSFQNSASVNDARAYGTCTRRPPVSDVKRIDKDLTGCFDDFIQVAARGTVTAPDQGSLQSGLEISERQDLCILHCVAMQGAFRVEDGKVESHPAGDYFSDSAIAGIGQPDTFPDPPLEHFPVKLVEISGSDLMGCDDERKVSQVVQ